MQRSGLNSIGLNLNSLWLARRAEYMEVFCNPGMLKVAEKSRITLRFIQATGMRSMSARGVCFFGYFLCTSKESNSLQQERNQMLVNMIIKYSRLLLLQRNNKKLWVICASVASIRKFTQSNHGRTINVAAETV
jgi:hypothetical protein